ncbi:FKBP-type peptidyl-prolyl cis-trans isomerase [Leeuwenhoekiella aequorea]|uniref:Peptidyl-prolyl cis-trans isomerase n=1 Tax=Leeuwenhoekiella aequorea TaxID=283736 RepID=A0A4Q0PBA1_9FLAO|nr:FKBP-type peptidyl-prolyl cis-trans isomerase [Leeuwenhoekiella aequorea]RXG23626.1 FKBP-type peptidyl-prolyl isomerase-like protein [Leeuwenhoekiella aequorea]
MKIWLSLICALTLFSSCSSDDSSSESEAEAFVRNEAEINAYLEANDLTATRSSTGLYYIIETEGTGESPEVNSTVKVTYTGYLLNGNIFDQSNSEVEFNAGKLISGFSEGLTYMKEGGQALFLIPARLAYGASGAGGSIPGNTVILFEVNLIEVL